MEAKMSFLPGFNFEQRLFFPQQPVNNLISEEFDYLILLLEYEALATDRVFDQDYLSYLKKIKEDDVIISSSKDGSHYWWGEITDIELSQKINSKIFSHQVAKNFDLVPESCRLIENAFDFKNHIQQYKEYHRWVVKSPYSFSGLGNKVFDSTHLPQLEWNEPVLLEPWFNRTLDIGMTYLKQSRFQDYFGVQNLNDPQGRFKGALIQPFMPEVEELHGKLKPALHYLSTLSPENNLQIDAFYYLEEGERKIYPLVEINCRKTMGWVTWSLWKKFGTQNIGVFLMWPTSALKKSESWKSFENSIGDQMWTKNTAKGFLPLSPLDRKFMTFFLVESNIKQAQNQIVELWNKLSKKESPLPLEFMIYF